VQGALLLNVVVRQSSAIFELLSSEDKTLLIRWNSFLVLDLGLDVFNGVRALHLEGDGLPRQSLHKNLHLELLLFPAKTTPKKKRRKITRKSEEKKKFQKLCPQRLE